MADKISLEELTALHIEFYNTHPRECALCAAHQPCVIVRLLPDGGFCLVHEADLEKVEQA
jgi:hypothetical protein